MLRLLANLQDDISLSKDISDDEGAGKDSQAALGSTDDDKSGSVVGNQHDNSACELDSMNENEWQAVFHEDSGQHYYWNIKTGKTTWEKPTTWKEDSMENIATEEKGTSSVVDTDEIVVGEEKGPSFEVETAVPEIEPADAAGSEEESVRDSLLDSDKSPKEHPEREIAEGVKTVSNPDLDGEIPEIISGSECEEEKQLQVSHSEPRSPDLIVQTVSRTPGESSEKNVKNRDSGHELSDMDIGETQERPQPKLRSPGTSPYEPSVSTSGSVGEKDLHIDGHEPSFPGQASKSVEAAPETCNGQYDGLHEEEVKAFMQWGETLAHRAKIQAGDSLAAVPLHIRLAIEAETRIYDCKAFTSQGILPELFWNHMKSQFKHLESFLAVEEAAIVAKCEQELLDPEKENHSISASCRERSHPGDGGDGTVKIASFQPECSALHFDCGGEVEEGEIQQSDSADSVKGLDSLANELVETAEMNVNKENVVGRDEAEQVLYERISDGVGSDVDMEVDMEVDDDVTVEGPVPGIGVQSELELQSASLVAYSASLPMSVPYVLPPSSISSLPPAVTLLPPVFLPSAGSEQLFPVPLASDMWAPPPLPPDDDWAPPPPPDSETIPPPLPEEPPPSPPQFPQAAVFTSPNPPPPAYEDHLTSEYVTEYLPASDYLNAPDSSYYQMAANTGVLVDDVYVAEVPGTSYLENTESAEMMVGMQAFNLPPGSATAFSSWPIPPAPSVSSVLFVPPAPLVASPALVPSAETVPSVTAPVQSAESIPSVSTLSSAPSDSSEPVPSIISVGSMGTTDAKKAAKGKVTKKRIHSVAVAPMLRTNKKVSTLVSKWKQAKEELHGSDEDANEKPLYDLEALERKRQKEIEEWRRQQIASGEALENANFQPLGTLDWRERVKRARKAEIKEHEASSESAMATIEAPSEDHLKKKKPDLEELSRDLPIGWQAYWDETSGDVYYGNLTTQETTWERPFA